MASLVIASPTAGSGKSMIAAALARKLAGAGHQITEAPTGEMQLAKEPDVRVIVVSTPLTKPDELSEFMSGANNAVAMLNRVSPRRVAPVRKSYEDAGLRIIGVVPEDKVLASPSIGQVAEALSAEGVFIEENLEKPIDTVIIASIAADPGQTYFNFTQANAVIIRSDKPDLQLAALNAGCSTMILTGGLPVLSYVLERVDDDEIPLLRTKLDTKETVSAIEGLFGAGAFSGAPEKLRRLDELMADVNLDMLLQPATAS
ncbi:MAG: DRTGG domain-containing protein [Chloroflexota bacterium]